MKPSYQKFLIALERKSRLFERKYRPSDVHKATGISTATLSDWKSGKSAVNAEKLYKIAKFFDVPMEFFMEEED